jgi:hypothetical protein
MSRPRDYAYEALAQVTGSDQTQARGELNGALKSIREQSPEITDNYILSDEIHTRAKMYRQVMPDVILTPSALAKHWLRVFEESAQRKTRGTNLHSDSTACPTCGGDRFVLVSYRSPAMRQSTTVPDIKVEEYAPCPDCHGSVDASFWRADGTRAVPPDPARVREMMKG